MATTGYGKTKHTNKCSNNKKNNMEKMTKPQTNTFSKYCKDNTKNLT